MLSALLLGLSLTGSAHAHGHPMLPPPRRYHVHHHQDRLVWVSPTINHRGMWLSRSDARWVRGHFVKRNGYRYWQNGHWVIR